MKQKNTQILPVTFSIDLTTVTKIEFIFNQYGRNKWKCEYPSDVATLSTTGTNTVNVKFSQDVMQLFKPDDDNLVEMDTRITLAASDENPQTNIVSFAIDKALFL